MSIVNKSGSYVFVRVEIKNGELFILNQYDIVITAGELYNGGTYINFLKYQG